MRAVAGESAPYQARPDVSFSTVLAYFALFGLSSELTLPSEIPLPFVS